MLSREPVRPLTSTRAGLLWVCRTQVGSENKGNQFIAFTRKIGMAHRKPRAGINQECSASLGSYLGTTWNTNELEIKSCSRQRRKKTERREKQRHKAQPWGRWGDILFWGYCKQYWSRNIGLEPVMSLDDFCKLLKDFGEGHIRMAIHSLEINGICMRR